KHAAEVQLRVGGLDDVEQQPVVTVRDVRLPASFQAAPCVRPAFEPARTRSGSHHASSPETGKSRWAVTRHRRHRCNRRKIAIRPVAPYLKRAASEQPETCRRSRRSTKPPCGSP